MKSRFVIFTLALILAMGLFVSAFELSDSSKTFSLTPLDNEATFTITEENDSRFNLTQDFPLLKTVEGVDVMIDLTSNKTNITEAEFLANVNSTQLSNKDYNFGDSADFTINTVNASNGSITDSMDVTVNLRNNDFCLGVSNEAELDVEIDRIRVLEGFGDGRDGEFYPLDLVEVTFDVSNREGQDWDLRDVEIEIWLYDLDGNTRIITERDMDLSDEDFRRFDGGDRERGITATFEIDPFDLDFDSENYEILVRATGEIDDSDAGDFDKTNTCAFDSEEVEIILTEFVVITNVRHPETISCGQNLEILADVWNIDDRDLEDDQVFVRVFSSDLQIDEVVEFDWGIRALDKETISVPVQIPESLEDGFYSISFIAYDDEDMRDGDVFELNRRNAEFTGFLEVTDCVVQPKVDISATLETEAIEGEEMLINVLLTNTADEIRIFNVDVSGYESWATLISSSDMVAIDTGDSEIVEVRFDVHDDAAGLQAFNINLVEDGEIIATQEVSVTIEETEGFLGGITGFTVDSENAYLWGLGFLNVILVIVIIFVAIRIARRNRAPSSEF